MMRYAHPHGSVFYRKMSHERPMISHGRGVYLYDVDGNQYIDGSGGPFVVNVGHGRTEIIEAIKQQLESVAYVHAIMFTGNSVEEYAAELARIVPIPEARFFFLSSGSEVVEGALKLARQIQLARGEEQRHLIIGRHQSYHGMTLGALSVSGRPALRAPYLDMMASMAHIPPPYPYRDTIGGAETAKLLEETIVAYGPENIAAFIAEPISGASLGAVAPPDEYWPMIRRICDRFGVLLIVDEVLVGMGRTGRWWGIDHWSVEPDILVTSKGAAGGYYPLGFIAARGDDINLIKEVQGDFNHGGTFSHHLVGAAAGLATLQVIQKERLVEKARVTGAYMGERLTEAVGQHPNVGEVRGRGLFWGIEFVTDRKTKEPFRASRKLAWQIWQRAFDLGLAVYYSQGCADGINGDVIMIGPPLIIERHQIDDAVTIIHRAIVDSLGRG